MIRVLRWIWPRSQSAYKPRRFQSTRISSNNSPAPRKWLRGMMKVGLAVGHSPTLALLLAATTIVPGSENADAAKCDDGEEEGKRRTIAFTPVNPATLTHKYLLMQTSVAVMDAVLRTSTQAMMAYLQCQDEYRASLNVCLELTEYSLTVLGNRTEEEKVYEAIVAARARADDRKRHLIEGKGDWVGDLDLVTVTSLTESPRPVSLAKLHAAEELERLLSSVSKLVLAAVETALVLDNQLVSALGSQHQYQLEKEMRDSRAKTRQKEKELLLLNTREIHQTNAHNRAEEKRSMNT